MQQTYYLSSRPLFVTLTAWLFIVLATVLCALGLAQTGPGDAAVEQAATGYADLMQGAVPWLQGAGLMGACGLLVGAIGLLLRREWARRVVIVLLAIVMVANVAGLWLQYEFVQAMVNGTLQHNALPAEAVQVVGQLVVVAKVMGFLLALMLSIGLGWMIRRLRSPIVRQEFLA
jgi:hypothetical protein